MFDQNLLDFLFSSQKNMFYSFFQQSTTFWELDEKLNHWINTKSPSLSANFSNVYILNKEQVIIEEGAKIAPGSLLEGPCYIGKNVTIGHCALIRPGTFLSEGVTIGHCSEISRSIFLEDSKAPHFNYVGDSIIGKNVNLGAHATLSNLRLDKKEIEILFDGKKIKTGKKKFGSLVGDNVSIGCHVVLNPGTVIEKNAKIYSTEKKIKVR